MFSHFLTQQVTQPLFSRAVGTSYCLWPEDHITQNQVLIVLFSSGQRAQKNHISNSMFIQQRALFPRIMRREALLTFLCKNFSKFYERIHLNCCYLTSEQWFSTIFSNYSPQPGKQRYSGIVQSLKLHMSFVYTDD